MKPKVVLEKTHWSAEEFIALMDALLNAESDAEAEAAVKALKDGRQALESNRKKLGVGHEARN